MKNFWKSTVTFGSVLVNVAIRVDLPSQVKKKINTTPKTFHKMPLLRHQLLLIYQSQAKNYWRVGEQEDLAVRSIMGGSKPKERACLG